MKKKLTVGHVVIIVVLILLTVICLYPMWYTFIMSFSDKYYVEGGRVWLFPIGINFKSYIKIIEDKLFFGSIGVSVKRVIVGCAVNMFLMVITAYPMFLPREKFPAARYIRWFFLANMLIGGGMIPTFLLNRSYGLMENFWVMILPGAVPLGNVIFMINFFRSVPYELNESATMDGANPFQILFRIYIPLTMPSLMCMLLFQFVGHWNAWFDGMIYFNQQKNQPLQTYIQALTVKIDYMNMTGEQIAELSKTSDKTLNAAKVMVSMIPILLIYPFIQKYFTTGMNLGAVKE